MSPESEELVEAERLSMKGGIFLFLDIARAYEEQRPVDLVQYFTGNASVKYPCKAAASMAGNGDEICVLLLGRLFNHRYR